MEERKEGEDRGRTTEGEGRRKDKGRRWQEEGIAEGRDDWMLAVLRMMEDTF